MGKHTYPSLIQEAKQDKFIVILPLFAIIIRIIIFFLIPLTYEDAYITFRYAENFADGLGLVYNVGEKVYGTTTPLYALIIGLFNVIGIGSVAGSLIVNLISEGVTTLIVYKLLKNHVKGFLAVIVSLLYVFSPSNISWAVQGMETAFFSAVIAVSFYSFYKTRYFSAIVFAFLASCIRIDGLSVVAVILAATFFECKLKVFKLSLFPGLIFIGWLLFLYLYFGNFLPNSMIAKLIIYSGHQTSYAPNLNLLFSKFFESGKYSSTIVTILFLIGSFHIIKSKNRLTPLVAWIFIYFSSLVISKTTMHGWYLIPPLFAYIIISGMAVQNLVIFISTKFTRLKILSYSLVTVFIVIFGLLTLYLKMNQMYVEYRYEQDVRIKMGEYLNKNTDISSSVLLEPIGVIGYFSERYVYDDIALISPIFLDLNRLPYTPQNRYKKVDLVKPDYIILREDELDDFYSQTEILNEYTPIERFNFDLAPNHPVYRGLSLFERK
jgi:hypothetical protein